MAIAEPEPKKSDIAVASIGSSEKVAKNLGVFRNFKKVNSVTLSSTQRTVNTYDLYKDVKYFSFYMPDGWNENNIGIFLETCHENLDILKNPEIELRRKWESIAFSGAMKSGDSTLFTINGCIAVAESLTEYIASQENCLSNNDSFKKLRNELLQLLPHFLTRDPLENFQRNGSNSTKSEVNIFGDNSRNEYLEDMIIEIINKNISHIKEGNQFIWNEISKKIAERIGISVDAKAFMTAKKRNIIIEMTQEEDLSKRKSLFIESIKKVMDVFDFIEPKSVTKNYYLSPVPLKNGIVFLNGGDGCSRNAHGSGGYSSQHGISDRSPSTCRYDKIGQSQADGNSVTSGRKKGRQRRVSRNKGSNKANDTACLQVIDIAQKKEFNEVGLSSENEIAINLAVPSKSENHLNSKNDNITPTRKKNKCQVNRKNLSSQDINVPSKDSPSKVGQSSESEITDRLTESSKSGKVDPSNENYNITQVRKKHKQQKNRKNSANLDIDVCSKSTHKAGRSSKSEISDRLAGTLKSGPFDHCDSESNEIMQTRNRNKHQVNRKNVASQDSNTCSKDGHNKVGRVSESHISDRLKESNSQKVDYTDSEKDSQAQKKNKQQVNRNHRLSQDSDTCLKDGHKKPGHSSEIDISDRLTGLKSNEQVHHPNSESNEIAHTQKKNKQQTNRKNEPNHDIYVCYKDKLKKSGLMSDSEITDKLVGSPKNNTHMGSPNIENNDRKNKKQVSPENVPSPEIDVHSKDKKKTRNSNENNTSDNLSRLSKSDTRMSHPNSESNDMPQLRKGKQHAMNIKNVTTKDVCSKDKLKAHLSENEFSKCSKNSDYLTNKEERKKNKQQVETKQDSNTKHKNNAGESCKYKISDNSSKLSKCSRNTEQCVTENLDSTQNSNNNKNKEGNNKSSESNTSNDIIQIRKIKLRDKCKNTNVDSKEDQDPNKAGQTYESGISDTLLTSSPKSSRKSFHSAPTSNIGITQNRKKNKQTNKKFYSKDEENQDSYSNDALNKSDQKIPVSLTISLQSNKKNVQSEINCKNLTDQDIDCISKKEPNNSEQEPESRISENGPGATKHTKQLEHCLTENKNFTLTKKENKQLEKNHNLSKDAECSSKEDLNKSGPVLEKISEKILGSTGSLKQLDYLLTESKTITQNKKKRKRENITVEENQDLFTGSKKKCIKTVHPSKISRPTKSCRKVNNLSTKKNSQAKSSKKHQELFPKNERNNDVDNYSTGESDRIGWLPDSGNSDKVIDFTISNNKMDSNFTETKDTTKSRKKNKQHEVIHKNVIQDIDSSSKKEPNKSRPALKSNISKKVTDATGDGKHLDQSPDNKDILLTRKEDEPQEKTNKNASSKDTENSSKEENKSGQTLLIKKKPENVSGSTRSNRKLDQSLTENKDSLQTETGNKQQGKNHKNNESRDTQSSNIDDATKSGHPHESKIFENVSGSTRKTKKLDHSLTENQGILQTKKENKQQYNNHKNAGSKDTEKSFKEKDKKSGLTLESQEISENVSGSTRSTKKLNLSLTENQGISLTKKENIHEENDYKSATCKDTENSSNELGHTVNSKISRYVSEPTSSTNILYHALTENKDTLQANKKNKQQENNNKNAASKDTEVSSKTEANKLERIPESKISEKVSGPTKSIKQQEHSLAENKDVIQTTNEKKRQENNNKNAASKDTEDSSKNEANKLECTPESKIFEKVSGSTKSIKQQEHSLAEDKDVMQTIKENKQQEKNNTNAASKDTEDSSKKEVNKLERTPESKISEKVSGPTKSIKQKEHSLAENKDVVQTIKGKKQQEKNNKNAASKDTEVSSKKEVNKLERTPESKNSEKVSGSTKSIKQQEHSLADNKDVMQTIKENKQQEKNNKNAASKDTEDSSKNEANKLERTSESKISKKISGSTKSIKQQEHSLAENKDVMQTIKENKQQEKNNKNAASKDTEDSSKNEANKLERTSESKISKNISGSTKSIKQQEHSLAENKDVMQTIKENKQQENNNKNAASKDTEVSSKTEANKLERIPESKISEKVSGSTKSIKQQEHSLAENKDVMQTIKENKQQEKNNKNAASKDTEDSSKKEAYKLEHTPECKNSEKVSGPTKSIKQQEHSLAENKDVMQKIKENKRHEKNYKTDAKIDTGSSYKEEKAHISGQATESKTSDKTSGSTRSTKKLDRFLMENNDLIQARNENRQLEKNNKNVNKYGNFEEYANKSGYSSENKISEKVTGSTIKQQEHSLAENKDIAQISKENIQEKSQKNVTIEGNDSISKEEPEKSELAPVGKIPEKESGSTKSTKQVDSSLTEYKDIIHTRKENKLQVKKNKNVLSEVTPNCSIKDKSVHILESKSSERVTESTRSIKNLNHSPAENEEISQTKKKNNQQEKGHKNVVSKIGDSISKEDPAGSEYALVSKIPEKVSESTKSSKQLDHPLTENKDVLQDRKGKKQGEKNNKKVRKEGAENSSKDKSKESGHTLENKISEKVSTRSTKKLNHSPIESDVIQTRKINHQQEKSHTNAVSKDSESSFKEEPNTLGYALESKIIKDVSGSTGSSKKLDHSPIESEAISQTLKENKEPKTDKNVPNRDNDGISKEEPENVSGSTSSTKQLLDHTLTKDIDITQTKPEDKLQVTGKNDLIEDTPSCTIEDSNNSEHTVESKNSENVSGSTRSKKQLAYSFTANKDYLQFRKENKEQKIHKNVANKDIESIYREEPNISVLQPETKITGEVSELLESKNRINHPLTENNKLAEIRKKCWEVNQGALESSDINISSKEITGAKHLLDCETSGNLTRPTKIDEEVIHNNSDGCNSQQLRGRNKQHVDHKNVGSQDINPSLKVILKKPEHSSEHEICNLTKLLDNNQKVEPNSKINDFKQTGNMYKTQLNHVNVEGACSKEDSKKVGILSLDTETSLDTLKMLRNNTKQDLHSSSDDTITLIITRRKKGDCKNAGNQEEPNKVGHSLESKISNSLKGSKASSENVDHHIVGSDSITLIENKNEKLKQNNSTCSKQEPNKCEGVISDNLIKSAECVKEAMVNQIKNKNTTGTKNKNIELNNMVLSQDVGTRARKTTFIITEKISFEQMDESKKQQEYCKSIENQDIDNCSKEEHGNGVPIEIGISVNLVCPPSNNKKEHLSASTIHEISPGKGKRKRNHTNEEKQVGPNKAGCSVESEICENLIGPTKLPLPDRECNQVRKKRKLENPIEPVMDDKGIRELKDEANQTSNTHSTQGTKIADHLSDSGIPYNLIETRPNNVNIDKPFSESIVVVQSETNKYEHINIKNKTNQQDLCSLEGQNKKKESLKSDISYNLIGFDHQYTKPKVILKEPVESNSVTEIQQNEEGIVSCTKEVNLNAKTYSIKALTKQHSPEYEASYCLTNSTKRNDKKEHSVIERQVVTPICQKEEERRNQKNAVIQRVDSCSVEEPKKVGQSSENEISRKLPGPITNNNKLAYADIDKKAFDIRLKDEEQMDVQCAIHQTIETFSKKGASKGEESYIHEIPGNLLETICNKNVDNPVTESIYIAKSGKNQQEELKENQKIHSCQNVHPSSTEKGNKIGDLSVGEISNELPESTTCNVTEVKLKEEDVTFKSVANNDDNTYLMGQCNKSCTPDSELSDTLASSKKFNYIVVDPISEISSNPEIKQNKKEHLNCMNETNQDEQLKVKDNCLIEQPREVVEAIKKEISDKPVTSITCNAKIYVPIIESNDVPDIQQKYKELANCLTKTNLGVRLTEEPEKGKQTESDIMSDPITLTTYDVKLVDSVIRGNDAKEEAMNCMNETNQDVDVNLLVEPEKGGLPESEISDNLATLTGHIKLDNTIIESNGATRVKESKEEHMDVSYNTNQEDASLMGELDANNGKHSTENDSDNVKIPVEYNVKMNSQSEGKGITNVTNKPKQDLNCLNVLEENVDSDPKTKDLGSCSNDELSKRGNLVESEISDCYERSSDCNKETDLSLNKNNVISQVQNKFKSRQENLMNTVIDNVGSNRIGDLAENAITANLKVLNEGRRKVYQPCSESNGIAQIRKRRAQTKNILRDVINAVGSDGSNHCRISLDLVDSGLKVDTTSTCKVPSNAKGISKLNDLGTIHKASIQVKQFKDKELISDVLKTKSVVSNKSVARKHQRKRSPPPSRSLPQRKAKMKQCAPKSVKLISDSQHYIDLPENIYELCTQHGIKFNKTPIINIKPLAIKTLREYDRRGELKEYLLNNDSCNSNSYCNPPQSLRTSNDQPLKSSNPVVESLQANCRLSKDCLSTTSNLNIAPTDTYVPSSLKGISNTMGTAGCSSISSRVLQNYQSKPDSDSRMVDRNSSSLAKNITPTTSNTGSNFLKVRPLSSLQDIHTCNLNPPQKVIVSTSPNSNDMDTSSPNNHMPSNLMQPVVNQSSSKTCSSIVSFSPSDSNEIVVGSTSTIALNSVSILDPSKIVVKTSSTFKESSTINPGKMINKPLPLIASKSQNSKPPDTVDKLLFQSKKTNVPNDTVLDPSHDILSLFYVPKPRNVNFDISLPEITSSFERVVENREEGFLGFSEPELERYCFETSQRMVNIGKEVLGFRKSRYASQSNITLQKRGSQKGLQNQIRKVGTGPSKYSNTFYDLVYNTTIPENDCSLSCCDSPSKRRKIDLSEHVDQLKDTLEISNRNVLNVNSNCLTSKSVSYKISRCRCILQASASSGDAVTTCNCQTDDLLSEKTIESEGERSLVAASSANLTSFFSNIFEGIKDHQERMFKNYENMQKTIATIEEQKVSLLQKVLDKLCPSKPD